MLLGRLVRWLLMVVVLGGLGHWLRAGEADGMVPELLVTIGEVNRILGDPSELEPRSRVFRGVVTFVSRGGDLCVQEGGEGVMIDPPEADDLARLGEAVEVAADLHFLSTDATDPHLVLPVKSVRRLGPGSLPEPERPWLAAALIGKANRRWVEVEGVLMQAALERGVVRLHLTDASGWAVVNVHDWKDPPMRDAWGARLRIRGANIGRGHEALRVTSSGEVAVVRPGTRSLFDAPSAVVAALRGAGPRPDRLRLTATVLAVHDGLVYLRSAQGPLRSSLLVPFASAGGQHHALELIPPETPDLQAGDTVELVGSPLRVSPWLEMSFSSFRQLGSGPLPAPVEAADRALAGEAWCDRVRLKAKVRSYEQSSGARGQIETLTLVSSGSELQAVLESARGDQLAVHRPGDILELTGVLLPPSAERPPVLLLAGLHEVGAAELAVVRRSLSPGVVRAFSVLTGGLALALAGAWWLQRQVRLRTAALAVANESLRTEVTAREQAQKELARALDQEREVGELKSRFVTMVSHEFRTPLGITMSAIELLRHHHDRLDLAQRKQLFDDIQRSTRGMGELMEQVLVLGRVEAGRVGCRPLPLDLDSLARRLADESLSATHHRSPIHWQAMNDLEGACADETLLRHIFSNLLSNAVKYSPDGAPVDFSCRREGAWAAFAVRDRGLGIPEADRPRLFEAFHRCSNVGDIPGTGLGLVIVNRCVALHGGTIDFTSSPRDGTTFKVRLPLFPQPFTFTVQPAS